MSAASDQKLFCKLCSPFNCPFYESVGEKGVSPSYSSAILTPPLQYSCLENPMDRGATVHGVTELDTNE